MNVKHFLGGALVGAALVTGGVAWSHGNDASDGDRMGMMDGMGMMGMMTQMQEMMSQCSAMMERMQERSPAADDAGAGSDDSA